MENFVLQETEDTPKIVFDPANNIFEISESSHPENPIAFFKPVLGWIEEYSKNPIPLTNVAFKLDYFNSSSAKYILNIIRGFEQIQKTNPVNKVVFHWYHKEDNPDSYTAGERYSQLTDSEFHFILF